MPLKFRLKGLAETFIDRLTCPCCGHDGGEEGDKDFSTDLTRVTYDGIIVVIRCGICGFIFVPDGQRLGVINPRKLRSAVERDSQNTGQPVFPSLKAVRLDVERLNAARNQEIH